MIQNQWYAILPGSAVPKGAPLPAADCVMKPTFLVFRYPNIWLNHISDSVKAMIYFAPVDASSILLQAYKTASL